MKKIQIRLVALLAVLCLIFCGCAVEDQTVTVDGLTITIPGDYVDCGKEDYAAGYTMVYGSTDGAVMALKESRSVFAEYGLENMTVEEYVQLLKEGYQLNLVTEESNGAITFTFENQGNTYLAAAYASEDAFWLIQAGCPTGDFKSQEETFRNILNSVTFA